MIKPGCKCGTMTQNDNSPSMAGNLENAAQRLLVLPDMQRIVRFVFRMVCR